MATWEQLNFQNSSSPLMEQFIFLHGFILMILSMILTLVFYFVFFLKKSSFPKQKMSDNHELETLWTFLPGMILILVAFPSLRLLYMTEENKETPMNIKTMGHQWYWSYEYSDMQKMEYDSFMLPLENSGQFRLLDVDNHLAVPEKTPIQMFISSTDVLHSWALPSLGIKIDSTPGRLNTINFVSMKPGLYFGQCSEICGTNHSFMPIVLDTRPISSFKTWLNSL
uniref:Cytochrome c oxidase subunit 2 n=1 Tax=Pseudobiotus spinifer TaxID=1477120 RepID=A0A0K0KB03_9BILA|nr:cytochrome c oxidase subunit II [Pseudobiotus spinifer]